jgi:hypothetical protein
VQGDRGKRRRDIVQESPQEVAMSGGRRQLFLGQIGILFARYPRLPDVHRMTSAL